MRVPESSCLYGNTEEANKEESEDQGYDYYSRDLKNANLSLKEDIETNKQMVRELIYQVD